MSDNDSVVRVLHPTAAQLHALAHPVRSRLLGALRFHGPATATALAARLGTNSGATSYHLRQLADAGLVEDDVDRSNGRDRWWRSAHDMTSFRFEDFDDDPDTRAAAGWLLRRHAHVVAGWLDDWLTERDDWLELPSGGLADALGRKPVLVLASGFSMAATAVLLVTDTVALLAVACTLQGIFRALDSGPLQAWFIDASLEADPGVDISRDLALGALADATSISTAMVVAAGVLAAAGPLYLVGGGRRPARRLEPVETAVG